LDGVLKQTRAIETRKDLGEQIMDSNDQERERGITILSKNTGVPYGDYFINIVDTPGHADMGGQVERVLSMVDAALLLVDAFDGPMPQTRFVLSRALSLGLKLIVLINKIDRPGARPREVLSAVYDLFIELGADDAQLDFPVLFTSAKLGYAVTAPEDTPQDLKPLLDCIVANVPAPAGDPNGPFQFLVSSIEYDRYQGRLLIGRIRRGSVKVGDAVVHIPLNHEPLAGKITHLYTFRGLVRLPVEQAGTGDIVAMAGIPDATVSETLADPKQPDALPGIAISQPTVSMMFRVNDSPLAGTEGKYVTSRHLRERLFRELLSDVALKVEETDTPDEFSVSGRGLLHLGILIENMRREGFEFAVSRPQVILQEIEGKRMEPVEELILDVPEVSQGVVMESLGRRKADLKDMTPTGSGRTRLHYMIPTRTLMGFGSDFLTLTRGEGIMTHAFLEYAPFKGALKTRGRGVLISMDQGESVAYAIWQLQERGTFIIPPHFKVYEGMIVGLNSRDQDMVVNVQRKKQLTNVRSSGKDDAIAIIPHVQLSLEQALELIEDDELVEVTPECVRLRKRILNHAARQTWEKRNKAS
jgi:GTP-binding protein